jgi:hypothetical protein
MHRLGRIAIFAAVAVGMALGVATPATAATPRIEITKVYYDSPGADKGSNSSLNDEYIRLTNRRSYTINLNGWTIRDKASHIYTFKTDFKLGPSKSVYLHTGKGENTSRHRYWGRGWYVWNNTGDKAYLRNKAGTLVDTCSWGNGAGYTYCK